VSTLCQHYPIGRAVARSEKPGSQTGVKGTVVPLQGAGQGSLGGFQGPLTSPLRAAAGGKRAFATALTQLAGKWRELW